MRPRELLSGPLSLPPNRRFTELAALLGPLPPNLRLESLQAVENALDGADDVLTHYNWPLHARLNQAPPLGSWSIWLLLAGPGDMTVTSDGLVATAAQVLVCTRVYGAPWSTMHRGVRACRGPGEERGGMAAAADRRIRGQMGHDIVPG